jgi:hypothetical protein
VKDFEWKPHVFPRYLAPVIIERKGVRQVVPMHYGLIPSFEMNAKPKMVFHNARSETIKEKPSFKKAYQESRCLIPLDSFFEYVWEADPSTGKEKSHLVQFFEKQVGKIAEAESVIAADAASIKKAPGVFLRSLTAAGSAERIAVERKVAEISLAIDKQRFEGEMATLKTAEAVLGKNYEARIVLAKVYADKMKVAHGAERQAAQASHGAALPVARQLVAPPRFAAPHAGQQRAAAGQLPPVAVHGAGARRRRRRLGVAARRVAASIVKQH